MSAYRELPTFVLDAGALVALEKSRSVMIDLLMRLRVGKVRIVVPDAVVAQVWRGGAGRQARLSMLLGTAPELCVRLPLDTDTAKRVGAHIASCGHTDVVDVHVALAAREYGAGVITSEGDDILAVDAGLKNEIVEV